MRKILALFLIVLVLCPFVVACNNDVPDTSKDDTEASTEEKRELFSNLPKKNYGDKTVTIYVEGDTLSRYKSIEIVPHESAPDIISEAVLERNARVEEHFGVQIAEIRTANTEEMSSAVQDAVATGLNTYDIVMAYLPGAGTLAANDCLVDLSEYKDILHFDEPYWDAVAAESLSIAGKYYTMVGDMNLLAYDCTHCIVFNKDVVADHNLENPYQLVRDGEWTLDKLLEMAQQVTVADEDGQLNNLDDTWGFLVNNNYATTMYFGSGATITTKNDDDLPAVAIGGEKSVSVFNKIFNICNDSKVVCIDSANMQSLYTNPDCYTKATESIASKRALFRSMAVADINELSDYECSYGIIPTPKYDTEQEEYYSYVSVLYASGATIPACAPDPEMSAIILDAMCQASTDTVKNNYYEVMLKYRKIADEDGADMLDIIFDNRVYDLIGVYNWGAANLWDTECLLNFMNTVAFSGTNSFASKLESIKPKADSAIDSFIEAVQ